MPHWIVGVDLGTHSIKAAVLEAGFRQLRLVDFIERPLAGGDAPQLTRAAQALRALVAEQGLHDATLYAALPGDLLSLRLLPLPFSDARKIDQVIAFELESEIVHDIDEVVLDYTIVDHPPAGGARVLVAAARKDDVRSVLDQLGESGLEARALFAGPLVYGALADRFLANEPGFYAIIDVGAERTNVCVLKGSRVHLARTLSRGSAHLTRALAKAYNLSPLDAERGKSLDAYAPHAAAPAATAAHASLAEIVREALAPLVRELRQTFALCAAEFGGAVEQAYVCGGGGRLRGLREHLAEELGVPTGRLELDGGPELGQLPTTKEEGMLMPLALAVALAGAMGRREIDFRRGELAYKADFSFLRAKATYLAVCLLAVLGAAGLNAYAALRQLATEKTVLDARLRTETTELLGEAQIDDPEAISRKIRAGIKMDELPVPAATAYDLLDEISTKIPAAEQAKVDIIELDIRAKKTFIKGTVDSAGTVDDIKAGLAKMPCFSSAKDDLITKGPITNVAGQQELKQFTLTIASKCP